MPSRDHQPARVHYRAADARSGDARAGRDLPARRCDRTARHPHRRRCRDARARRGAQPRRPLAARDQGDATGRAGRVRRGLSQLAADHGVRRGDPRVVARAGRRAFSVRFWRRRPLRAAPAPHEPAVRGARRRAAPAPSSTTPCSPSSGTSEMTSAPAAALPIRRNTLILAGTMAVYSAVLQLVAAVSSLTFVLVTGVHGLLGLGPAIFLTASALAAVPAGRAMDRFGRRPVIAAGFLAAAAGCSLTALATNLGSTPLVITGFALTGAASGDRAADPHRRGRPVPARAPRARHLLRPLRLGLRRDPRPRRVRPDVLRPRARGGRADRAVAGGRRDQPGRARARRARAPGPAADRRADRRPGPGGRAARRRAAARDAGAAGRAAGDARPRSRASA